MVTSSSLDYACIKCLPAVGEIRRHVENQTFLKKKIKIIEYYPHIWNLHVKCIQLSTDMPNFGSVIC